MRAALEKDINELLQEVAVDDVIQKDPRGKEIAKGRDRLRKLSNLLPAEAEQAVFIQVVIAIAIEHGAVLYNEGSAIGCAYLYDYAARIIRKTLEMPGNRLPEVTRRFNSVMFDPITPRGASERAWHLRHAFDDTLKLLEGPIGAPIQPTRATVFVSHSDEDWVAAGRIVARLEGSNIGCWVPQRDTLSGTDEREATKDAIKSCDVTLVLLSGGANGSDVVASELEHAVNCAKRIVLVRLDNVMPSTTLNVFIGGKESIDFWDDAPSSRDRSMRRLIETLRPMDKAGHA